MSQPARDNKVLYDTRVLESKRRQSLSEQYGGFYWGSDFIGFVVATFFTLVFFAIVGAIVGTVGYQMGAPVPKVGSALSSTSQSLGVGGLVGGLVALFLAYLIGGYTAGRMSRFAGVKNGIGVVIWTVVVAVILGIAGSIAGNRFNLASQLHLNISRGTLTAAGIVSIIVALVIMSVAAILGGMMGVNYHRSIDQAVRQG